MGVGGEWTNKSGKANRIQAGRKRRETLWITAVEGNGRIQSAERDE